MNKPSKQEQIEALNAGLIRELTLKHVQMELIEKNGKKEMIIPYGKVIDITRSEIKNYLKTTYLIEELVPPYPKEGLFAERENDGFRVYNQDYGRICDSWFVENEDALLDEYVKFIIDRSCTGLTFD